VWVSGLEEVGRALRRWPEPTSGLEDRREWDRERRCFFFPFLLLFFLGGERDGLLWADWASASSACWRLNSAMAAAATEARFFAREARAFWRALEASEASEEEPRLSGRRLLGTAWSG
jgi:hypothetical protein